MARRYSGDVEVRLQWDARRRVYRGTVTDSRGVYPQTIAGRYLARLWGKSPMSSDAYDDAARAMIDEASRRVRLPFVREGGAILVRRVFQAPCPIG